MSQSRASLRFIRHCCPRATIHRHFSSSRPACAGTGGDPYYITTPIFYPNAAPHIGHLHSLVVADIFARFAHLAQPSRPVRFVAGTDEHGLKIQKAAKARGMHPQAFCDELSQQFRNLIKKADISATRFARTTEKEHCDAVQQLWRQLDSKGLIYKDYHQGWYSVSDECFYTDLQVTEKSATKPGEENYFVSIETGSRVEWMQEENYKFRLSQFRDFLASHFTTNKDAIYPPQQHTDLLKTLSEPLDDLSVSRPRSRLEWGIQVPNDPEHTIYVWIDALTVYLSSAGYPWPSAEASREAGWPANLQVIGKDILRFHAIYFPAMLQALDIPLPKRLLAHSHWTVDRHKMSKSVGNVADPIQAIDEFGIDLVRFYLARVGGRFKDDVDWSHEQLTKHSREVTSLLGNLYLRVTSSKIQSRVADQERPSIRQLANHEIGAKLFSLTRNLAGTVQSNMDNMQMSDALDAVVVALQEANLLMTDTAPWAKTTPASVALDVQTMILECLRVCGILLQPFMPSKSTMLLDALGVPREQRTLEFAELGKAQVGQIQPGVRLFEMPAQAKASGGTA